VGEHIARENAKAIAIGMAENIVQYCARTGILIEIKAET
jgi:hypothetical protein